MNDPILKIFLICSALSLILIVYSSLKNPNKIRINQLNDKTRGFKKELAELSINQLIMLNQMIKDGQISQENYVIEFTKLLEQFKEAGIDTSALTLIPFNDMPNKKEVIYKILNIANELHDTKQMDNKEFEKNIDNALDAMNGK